MIASGQPSLLHLHIALVAVLAAASGGCGSSERVPPPPMTEALPDLAPIAPNGTTFERLSPAAGVRMTYAQAELERRPVLGLPAFKRSVVYIPAGGSVPFAEIAPPASELSPECIGIQFWPVSDELGREEQRQDLVPVFVPLQRTAEGQWDAPEFVTLSTEDYEVKAVVRAKEVLPGPVRVSMAPFEPGEAQEMTVGIGLDAFEDQPHDVLLQIMARGAASAEPIAERLISAAQLGDGWEDVSLPLGHDHGSALAIDMVAQLAGLDHDGVDRASKPRVYLSEPFVLPAETEPPNGPNVIFISLDTLRADRTGFMGYERDTSPVLDERVQSGTVFDQAVANNSWTFPSHASIFTGLHPMRHGAGTMAAGWRLRDELQTLPEIAREEGYRVAAFTEGTALVGRDGWDQGYDRYHDGWEFRYPGGYAEKTFALARQWLQRHRGLPFFLFIHTYEVHDPYHPPRDAVLRFRPDEPSAFPYPNPYTITGPNEKQRAQDYYDAEIFHLDRLLGELFAHFDELEIWNDTLVVLFSDHGEQFWEHGQWGHGKTLYGEEVRVPLVVWLPGDKRGPARVEQPVSLIDLFATTLAAIAPDREAPASSHSLWPLLEPGSSSAQYRRPFLTASLLQHDRTVWRSQKQIVNWHWHAIRQDPWKLVMNDQEWVETEIEAGRLHPDQRPEEAWQVQLFNLTEDPGELNDLSAVEPERARKLRALLEAYLAEQGAALNTIYLPEDFGEEKQTPDTIEGAEHLEAIGYL